MKQLLILLSCILFFVNSHAQIRLKVDENTIVKDSAGTVYPYKIWQSLIFSGYSIRPADPKNIHTEFILFKLTDEQLKQRMEKMPKPKESLSFTTGKKITLFNSPDIYGNKLKLKKETGKIIVLNFWFIDCAPCRMEIPDLNELANSYKGRDSVLFIAVALDKRWDIKDFLKQTPFNYTIVDDGKYLAEGYGIKSFPTHVVVDTEGKVYFHTSGLSPNTVFWIKKSIDELLQKKPLQ